MLDFLKNIVDMFGSLFSILFDVIMFLVNAIMGLLDLIAKLPTYTNLMTSGIVALPAYCQTALATSIAVVILWIVIKRGPAE